MTPLFVALLLLRLLLPAGTDAVPRSGPGGEPAAHATAGHAGHAAAGRENSHDRDEHHASGQGCHFCRLDGPLLPPPSAPGLDAPLLSAPVPPPAGPPPRLRDFTVRVRARAPPAST